MIFDVLSNGFDPIAWFWPGHLPVRLVSGHFGVKKWVFSKIDTWKFQMVFKSLLVTLEHISDVSRVSLSIFMTCKKSCFSMIFRTCVTCHVSRWPCPLVTLWPCDLVALWPCDLVTCNLVTLWPCGGGECFAPPLPLQEGVPQVVFDALSNGFDLIAWFGPGQLTLGLVSGHVGTKI